VFFEDFVAGWMERHAQRVRPSTHERAGQAVRTVRELSRWRVNEVCAADVEDVITVVGRRAPRQAGIALQYAKQVLRNAEQPVSSRPGGLQSWNVPVHPAASLS
jgi:hypothetical protein